MITKKYQPATAGSIGFTLFLILLLLYAFPQPGTTKEKKSFIIAVVPQLPPVAMHANWSPFLEELKKETGEGFRLKAYETMGEFEADYEKGVPDFLFSNPVQATFAHRTQGYAPLVRSSKQIAGVLFVKKDSEIKTVQDLQGKEVAFVGSKNI